MTNPLPTSETVRGDEMPSAERRARRRRPRLRRVLIGVGGVLLACGSVAGVDLVLEQHDQSTVSFRDPVSSVHADVSAGSVQLVGNDDPTVTLERRIESGIRGPSHDEWVDDGKLVIRSSCPLRVLTPACGVDYIVHVPRTVSVEVDGDGLSADIVGIDGSLDVSINGGDVDAQFHQAPTMIKARSNGGDIDIAVPDDGLAYRVDASSNGGSIEVDVRTNPESDRVLDLYTNGGSIRVTYTGTP